MRTSARIGCVLLLAALAGTAFIAWIYPPRPAANLLIITLDTTRADRLGCYGYQPAITPALDGLAAGGMLFEHAYSPAPLTLPSHATLFTGLYPPEHGLRTNGRGRLSASLPTLATRLAAHNYHCGAFVASFVLDARFGLDRGFATYDDDLTSAHSTPDALQRQRDGGDVVDAALAWLQQPRDQPFFCWVHLYDPHFPYDAHVDLFQDRFAATPYDAEIAYVDRQVQRLIDQLRAAGELERTLVVIVGDHGEGLGEHVERTHGYTLYNATQRVPLIMALPGTIPAGQRIASAVPLVDVFPTVLDTLKVSLPESMSGKSLTAAFQGQPVADRECYAATDDPFLQNGWSPLRSLTTNRWKYVRSTVPELYDLQGDPGETRNLASDNSAQREAMADALAALEQRLTEREAESVSLSAAERRTLESLGYLGGAKGHAAETMTGLPDVKEMLPFDVAVQDALDDLRANRVAEAVARLKRVVEESRVHVASRVYLGEALEREGKFEEAAHWYEEALRLKPDHPDALIHLGSARLARGAAQEAASMFREALRVDPHSAIAHFNLGLALARTGDLPQAIRQLQAALHADDLLPGAHGALGEMLILSGRSQEAIQELRREIELHPRTIEARVNLAMVLSNTAPDDSERLLREALAIDPTHPQTLYNLGALLILRGRPQEAIAPLSEVVRIAPDHPRAASELQRAKRLVEQQQPSPKD